MVNFVRLPVLFLLAIFNSGVAGWFPVESITNRSEANDLTCRSNARSVVCDPAGDVHIIWRGDTLNRFQVWYSFWSNASQEWSSDTVLSNDPQEVGDPAIACDSTGNIYITWITNGILKLLRRDFVTHTWSLDTLVTGNLQDSAVSLAVDRNGVKHFTWIRLGSGTPREIYYAAYTDSEWSRVDTVFRLEVQSPVTFPAIACSPDGKVMVVWHSATGSLSPIILARRKINNRWEEVETVYNHNSAKSPSVTWSDDSFHVVWIAGGNSILYRARGNGGWSDTLRLSVWTRDKQEPCIAADGLGNLQLAWVDQDTTPQRSRQICYRKRTPNGVWRDMEVLTEVNNDRRCRLSIAARMGRVYVAWSEPAGGSFAVRLRRYELIHDVGVIRIEQPLQEVDSGATFVPLAIIGNFGRSREENVVVRFSIDGSGLRDTILLFEPYSSISVEFDSFTAEIPGWRQFSCSTSVANDEENANDSIVGGFFVTLRDVVAESIIAPAGEIIGETVVPMVQIYNRGNRAVQCTTQCQIFRGLEELYSRLVCNSLDSCSTINITFPPWVTQGGRFQVRYSTRLPGDMHPENDTIRGEFAVVKHDVGVESVIWPTGQVDSGTAGCPGALVKNYGTQRETFPVLLRIGVDYLDTAMVYDLAPDSSVEVPFSEWRALVRGVNPVCCSTLLGSDRNASNDGISDTVTVRVIDVGPETIVSPARVISPESVRPVVMVANYGNEDANFWVRCEIQDSAGMAVYHDSTQVFVPPESVSPVYFSIWQAHPGVYTIFVKTVLYGDMVPGNDSLGATFRVRSRDVGVCEIIAPVDTVAEGLIQPMVVVANFGEENGDFQVQMSIFKFPDSVPVYVESVRSVLAPAARDTVSLPAWQAVSGKYSLVTWSDLSGDENRTNDTARRLVYVESLVQPSWQELPPVPGGPRNLPVRTGSCLVGTADRVFMLKGRSDEWYAYDFQRGEWETRSVIPGGVNGKKPRAGAAACWDGLNRIYLLKGGNTREFWCYLIDRDSWCELPSIPAYTRKIRYGSGLAGVLMRGTVRIFCLKGSGTNDLLVYWVERGEWHARRPVPGGYLHKAVKRGSGLVAVGGRVFCLKGGTNEFYEYLPARDTWVERPSLPFAGSNGYRRCKEGAALASDGVRFIYAFKGGRTLEFWRFDALTNEWAEMENIPLGRRNYRVGSGGALAWAGGKIYALKGGYSQEFWSYHEREPGLMANSPWETTPVVREPVSCKVAGKSGIKPVEVDIKSNTGGCLIFDVTGRVHRRPPLTPGVYFVIMPDKFDVKKVVICR